MTEITDSALVTLTEQLVEFESINPPGNEAAIVEFLTDRLQSSTIPFDIQVKEVEPGRPNITARAGDPSAGSVLLTGHVDVVPADANEWTGDPFELRREGGRLIGRGTADMKGALAAKLLAAEEYLSGDDPGEVILAFVVGEETTGFGTKSLVEAGIEADAAILGEPTNLQVGVSQKGLVRYTLTLSGQSVHSGRPDQGVNAIDGVRELLVGIEKLNTQVRTVSHELLSPGSVTVTEIEAGTAPNIVPDQATVTIDWRSVPGAAETTPRDYDRRIETIVEAAEQAVPGLEVEIDRWLYCRPAEVDTDSAVVQAVLSAASDVGVDNSSVGFDATTDARHLIHEGIPTVLFGPGSIKEDAHTVDESIDLSDLRSTAQVYRRAVEELLG